MPTKLAAPAAVAPATALPRRPWLGVDLAREPATDGGVAVVRVRPNSTGEAAGILAEDVIQEIRFADESAATTIGSAADVVASMAGRHVGERINIAILRGGAKRSVSATLQPLLVEAMEHATVRLSQVDVAGGALRVIATLPHGEPPFPTIFYLQSSDLGSCEHPLLLRHPRRRLMDALAERGYACVRLERSGVGDSGGPTCADVDFETELTFFRAGLRHVQAQAWAEPGRIYLFGNSLGGMLAPLLAVDEAAVGAPLAGIAVIGTTAASWHDCLLGNFRRQCERNDWPAEEMQQKLAYLERLQEQVLRQDLTPAQVFRASPELAAAGFDWFEGDRAYGRTVRYFQQLEAIDLRAAWRRVTQPVLVLHGADDWICVAADARTIVEQLDGERSALRTLPDVDHSLGAAHAPGAVAEAFAAWAKEWTDSRF